MTIISRFARSKWRNPILVLGLSTLFTGGGNPIPPTWSVALAQSAVRTPQVVTGALSTNSPKLEADDSYYELHTLEGNAGETLMIELTSDEFDAYLILISPTETWIAQDDDGAGERNARIIINLPDTGPYTLLVKSYEPGETGSYQLAWRTATAAEKALSEANQLQQQVVELYQAGRYAEAIPLAAQVQVITERIFGPNHLETATSLDNLAYLYVSQGRYSEAEPLFQRVLAITEQALGPNHPDTAISLHTLAWMASNQGRYEESESIHRQALSIQLQVLGAEHPDTATSLNGLAAAIRLQGRYEEAEPLYQQALEIRQRVLGDDHPDTAISLNDLATLHRHQGRYETAETLYRQAIAIKAQALGPEHPETAVSLNHLASLYRGQGRYEEAEVLYQQVLEIRLQAYGPDHPFTAVILNSMSKLYQAQGRLDSSLNYLSRVLRIEETMLQSNLVGGSDADKQDYIATVVATTHQVISLHLNSMHSDAVATQIAFTTTLQRKGRILDLFTNIRTQLKDDPNALTLLNELNQVNTQLSALSYSDTANPTQQTTLQNQLRDLEDALSRRSAGFAELSASVSMDDIQAVLPPSTALVEFIRYQPFDPTNASNSFGDDRYAAYILLPNGTVQGIDLGPAESIDLAVTALSSSLSSSDTPIGQVKQAAQSLETLVMAPVRAVLENTTTVFISPDGALNLIPFEALVDDSGNYLVENYQFRYLTSGRDLMRLDSTTASSSPALLIGNPTYGRPGELVAQADIRAIDFENRIFPALPGTQGEVDLIAPKLAEAEVYTETNATEAVIKQQDSPSILHIATHGFFEPSEEALNPLLQSGLILAGAGAGGQSGPDQDGILTALEVTGMNLSGTQLVVLSACETGLGEITAGEGVYGLRRAFVLAGSQTQVISLWKVGDTVTQRLMVDYYDRLLAGTPRDQSLRETQLAFLNSDEYSHPYYWAAFIGSGDWRSLQLQK